MNNSPLHSIHSSTGNGHDGYAADHHTDVVTAEPMLAKPPLFVIIMHNDNYTTMDFVVMVLMSELNHSPQDAYELTLTIHHTGYAKVGIFPKEIAETKVARITALAENAEFPLLVTLEAED
ncbi:MAG: ATP-dependent Clp protease adaptor ClpS [Moraxella sp.]|nr:ATP-dependent Clp protease adaptor ClpS [Moraxella sp.]